MDYRVPAGMSTGFAGFFRLHPQRSTASVAGVTYHQWFSSRGSKGLFSIQVHYWPGSAPHFPWITPHLYLGKPIQKDLPQKSGFKQWWLSARREPLRALTTGAAEHCERTKNNAVALVIKEFMDSIMQSNIKMVCYIWVKHPAVTGARWKICLALFSIHCTLQYNQGRSNDCVGNRPKPPQKNAFFLALTNFSYSPQYWNKSWWRVMTRSYNSHFKTCLQRLLET